MKTFTTILLLLFCALQMTAQSGLTKESSFDQIVRDDGVIYNFSSLAADETLPSNRPGIGSSLPCSEESSYFKAYYTAGSGFENDNNPIHLERREVLCHVLNTLSRYVIPANPERLVRIKVMNINDPEFGTLEVDNILAAAKPFLIYPLSIPEIGGFADNTVWKTINSGQDAYADLIALGGIFPTDYEQATNGTSFYYHALLFVNFNDEDGIAELNDATNLQWNYDVDVLCPSNRMDLYSVLLHEMIHCLGFATRISDVSLSALNSFKYFTRYDHFLKTPEGNLPQMNEPLIFSDSEPVWMYHNTFNQALSPTVMYPNIDDTDFDTSVFPPQDCGSTSASTNNNTNCVNAIRFSDDLEIPVYTPQCFQLGSSLSHLDDQCSNYTGAEYEYYLMAIGFGNGITRRVLQQDEHNILCALGYHLNDRMGWLDDEITDDGIFDNEMLYTSSCGGDQIVGIIDGIDEFGGYEFQQIGDTTLTLAGSQLMNNDLVFGQSASEDPDFRIEGLELIQGTGQLSVTGLDANGLITASSTIIFDPTVLEGDEFNSGTRMLRYVPVRNGVRGNITYVYVRYSNITVTLSASGAMAYEECSPSACNLIRNGNFEVDAATCSHLIRIDGGNNNITCWTGTWCRAMYLNFFTKTVNYDDINCDLTRPKMIQGSSNVCSVNSGQSQNSALGIFTYTFPATLTHNETTSTANQAVVLVPSMQNEDSGSTNSARLQSELSQAVIPGISYKLSFWAKSFDPSGLENFDCLATGSSLLYCQELCQLDYMNLQSFPRFFLSNTFVHSDEPIDLTQEEFDDMLETNTSDLANLMFLQTNNLHLLHLATPAPIPAIVYPATAEGDWHYREVIVTIPADAPADLNHIIIDNDIWGSGYQNVITGFFIDEISLTPYFGQDIVELPEVICPGSQINDLSTYITNSEVTGTFSCTDCPAGALGATNNSFNSTISGTGVFHLLFSYSDPQGCPQQDVSVITVDESGCCNLSITVDNVVPAACETIASGAIEMTVTNSNNNTTYLWTGPVSSTLEDPNELLPGTYNVVVQNGADCSATAEVVVGIIPATIVPPISSQQEVNQYLNNQTLHISGDLIFNANGETYEIENANLYFDASKSLRVNENASIGMDHVLLDACGVSWRGINLLANRNNLLQEGKIKLANYVTIKHALVGVFTTDAGSGINTPIELMRCGSMLFRNSQFIDNRVAVQVRRGSEIVTDNYTMSEVRFENTSFTWTDDLFNRFPTYNNTTNGKRMVEFWQYKDAEFIDCDFYNFTTSSTWNRRGHGIYGFQSKFDVRTTLPGLSTSRFEGFRSGVRSEMPTIATMGTTIFDVTFEKNQSAIFLGNAMFNRVNRNIIHVGLPTEFDGLDNAEVKYEGIAIRRGTGWEVSENDITGYILHAGKLTDSDLPYSVGVSVVQTISPNDEVYRNTLHGLNWGFVANGNNNSDEGEGGLRFICNENQGNNYDFVVADFPGAPGSSQIGEVQIDFPNATEQDPNPRAAGNKFSQGNVHPYNDFLNETQMEGIEYWYYDLNPNEILSSFNSFVYDIPDAPVNLCQSEIALLNADNYIDWIDRRNEFRQQWLNVRFIWKLLIDGGDTEALRDQVDDTFGADTWVERQKLLDISPYVSRTVLEAVADNTILFPHPVALEIFLANPDVLSDKTFILFLESKADPMPEYMIDILMNAADQTTVRTILEDELRDHQGSYLDAAQKVMRYELQAMDCTARKNAMKQMRNIPSTYMVLDELLAEGNLTEADSIYLESMALVGLGRNSQLDYDAYYQWFDISQRMIIGGFEWDSLPQAIIQDLETFVVDYPRTVLSNKAAAILNFFYDYNIESEVFVPETDPATKSTKRRKYVSSSSMAVFPIPASDLANIKLNIKDPRYLNATLSIHTMQGQLVYTDVVKRIDQQWALDIRDWPAGIYLVNITSNGLPVINEKLEIIR